MWANVMKSIYSANQFYLHCIIRQEVEVLTVKFSDAMWKASIANSWMAAKMSCTDEVSLRLRHGSTNFFRKNRMQHFVISLLGQFSLPCYCIKIHVVQPVCRCSRRATLAAATARRLTYCLDWWHSASHTPCQSSRSFSTRQRSVRLALSHSSWAQKVASLTNRAVPRRTSSSAVDVRRRPSSDCYYLSPSLPPLPRFRPLSGPAVDSSSCSLSWTSWAVTPGTDSEPASHQGRTRITRNSFRWCFFYGPFPSFSLASLPPLSSVFPQTRSGPSNPAAIFRGALLASPAVKNDTSSHQTQRHKHSFLCLL